MLEALSFTNLAAVTYDFMGDGNRVQLWKPNVQPRGSGRARMQAHGENPRFPFFGALTIHQEGLFRGRRHAAVLSERQAFLDALLGDLTVAPADSKLGTLTVKYIGWTESATGDVTADDHDEPLSKDNVNVLPYMITWRSFLPYFVGDDSSDPVNL